MSQVQPSAKTLTNGATASRTGSPTAKPRQRSIGIVGAGLAGLRCADVLLQEGFEVTVFEARNRIGGRVAQSNHLGHLVDLGPNWIHGTDDNPIMDLASHTNTKLHVWDEESRLYDRDGNRVDASDADEYNELLWGDDGLISEAFRLSASKQNTIDPKRSLYDFIVEKSKDFFLHHPVEAAEDKRREFLQYASMWGAYIGSPITRQSLRFFWLEECIHGENPFLAETYHKILSHVAQPALDRAEIRLQCEVVNVQASDSLEGTRTDDNENGRASVATADGEVLHFDEVVVAVPLGFLKHHKTKFFKPLLPERLSQAIDNISYGTLDKVYITFPEAWWTDTETEMHADDRGATSNPSFIHWLQPEYSQSTNPSKWMQEAMNLAALRSDCAHPTLLYYIQGPQSREIADIVTSHPVDQVRDAKLFAIFKPYYSLLPKYDETNPACLPKAVLATAWANDRFAGYGSYANFQVGLREGDEDIEVMREGMPDRRVWLSGEHTAPFVALGTTTGAYWSGEAVARQIAKLYGSSGKSAGS